jgi:hypothetical protein
MCCLLVNRKAGRDKMGTCTSPIHQWNEALGGVPIAIRLVVKVELKCLFSSCFLLLRVPGPGQRCRSKSHCWCSGTQLVNLVFPSLADWTQVRAFLLDLTRNRGCSNFRIPHTGARHFYSLLWNLCSLALKRTLGGLS